MTTRDDLLAALTAERYNGGGWRPTDTPPPEVDDDLTAARRRREMADDFEQVRDAEREAR